LFKLVSMDERIKKIAMDGLQFFIKEEVTLLVD
jgi:hypothetical protein